MFWYSNPLINQGAGRIKTDSINEQRIQIVLNKFEQFAKAKKIPMTYTVTKQQLEKTVIAFPLAGFAFGMLASYTFVHPNSKYVGKFFTLFTTSIGLWVHSCYVQSYNCSRRFGNFWKYPVEIRRMLDNNDARYAYKWLKQNQNTQVKQISGGSQNKQIPESANQQESQ